MLSRIRTSGQKRLSIEEERELAARIKKGDEQAVDIFVEANIGLVISISHEISKGRMESIPDFVSAGIIGLEVAARRFNPDKGKFATYASWWVKLEINRNIRERNPMSLPNRAFGCLKKVKAFIKDYRESNGLEPSMKEIQEEFPQFSKAMVRAIRFVCNVVSLDAPIGSGEDNFHHLISVNSRMPFDDMQDEEGIELLKESIGQLEEREQDIIRRRFGLGCKSQTLDEISHLYDLSRERIRQIETKALEKLKDIMPELE